MKIVALSVTAIAVTLGLTLPSNWAAPALGDKPVKWEYAELKTKRTAVPPPPGGAVPPGTDRVFKTTLQWSTEPEEIEGKDWKDLADKLKAPALKKEGSTDQEKLRLLNRLGADGWELVEHQRATTGVENWLFKRRLP
jgi:hypothetical protein